MAKYIIQNAGKLKETTTVQSSAGAGDADKIPSLDSTGRIDQSMMPVGIGADTVSIVASEALSAGDLVNIWDNASTPNVRKADASSTGKQADGFVLDAVSSGANATVYFDGTITGLTGLTGGTIYFLSGTTPGGVTATAVSTSGYISQIVGKAVSATELSFEPGEPIELA